MYITTSPMSPISHNIPSSEATKEAVKSSAMDAPSGDQNNRSSDLDSSDLVHEEARPQAAAAAQETSPVSTPNVVLSPPIVAPDTVAPQPAPAAPAAVPAANNASGSGDAQIAHQVRRMDAERHVLKITALQQENRELQEKNEEQGRAYQVLQTRNRELLGDYQLEQNGTQAQKNEDIFNELKVQLTESDAKVAAVTAEKEDAEKQAANQAILAKTATSQLSDVKSKLEAEIAARKQVEDSAANAEKLAAQAVTRAVQAERNAATLSNQLNADKVRAGRAVQNEEAAKKKLQAEQVARKNAEDKAAKAEALAARRDTYARETHANLTKVAQKARQEEINFQKQLNEATELSAKWLVELSDAREQVETRDIQLKECNDKLETANQEVQNLTMRIIDADKALETATKDYKKELAAKDEEIKNLKASCQLSQDTKNRASKLDYAQREAVLFKDRADRAESQLSEIRVQLQQLEHDAKAQVIAEANHEKAYFELEKKNEELEKKNKQLKDELALVLKYEVITREENSKKVDRRKKEGRQPCDHRRDGGRGGGCDDDRNYKRHRDDDHDDDYYRDERRNNDPFYRPGDLRPQLNNESTKKDNNNNNHYPHSRHNHHRNVSSEKTPKKTSPPPTDFQSPISSQQVIVPSTTPATDPRVEPKQKQQHQQIKDEEREEGELQSKKQRISQILFP